MKLISGDELKAKLDRGDDFNLVMISGEWAFRLKHIPGSLYCSGEACIASVAAYRTLTQNGFQNVRRYAGGLPDWERRGYPLEGDGVE